MTIGTASAAAQALHFFDLDAQSLSEALVAIGVKSKSTVLFSAEGLEQFQTRPVHGYLTTEQALRRALSLTPFAFEKQGDGIYVVTLSQNPEHFGAPDGDSARALSASRLASEIVISATRTGTSLDDLSPVIVVTERELRNEGAMNVARTISELPSVNTAFSSFNTNPIPNAAGLNVIDLHGAGPSRTLVLFDGRRIAPTNAGSNTIGVDLSAIPISAIRNVEILTGGASALYGPGAIAGVVNIDFHDRYEGLETIVQGGLATHGDAETILAEVAYGRDIFRGNAHLNVFASYHDAARLFQADRAVTAEPAGFDASGAFRPGFGGSDITAAGRIVGFGEDRTDFTAFDNNASYSISADGGAIEPFARQTDQLENFAAETLLLTPERRFSALASVIFENNQFARIKLELFGAHFESLSQMPPVPFNRQPGEDFSLFAPVTHPSFPDPVSDLLAAELTIDTLDEGVFIERRFPDTGPAINSVSRNSLRAAMIVDGDLGGDWSYSAHYQFAASFVKSSFDNLVDPQRLSMAVDPDLCAQTVNCTLIDPFGETSLTSQQTQFVRLRPLVNKFFTDQHNAAINVNGTLAQLRSGAITFAVGGDFRSEFARVTPDPELAIRNIPGVAQLSIVDGSFNSVEGYAEIAAPILSDVKWAEELSIEGAARILRVARSGLTYSVKGGIQYRPTEWATIRFTQQQALRAPNVNELFSQFSTQLSSFKDPCSDISLTTSAVIAANCASGGRFGVGAGFRQTSFFIDTRLFNNIDLREERANTLSVGAKISLSSETAPLRSIDASIDFFRINIKDAISTPSLSSVLASCYASVGFSSPACGENPVTSAPIFSRNVDTDQITAANLFPLNSGQFAVSGLDYHLSALIAPSSVLNREVPGNIAVQGNYSFILDAKQKSFSGDSFVSLKRQLRFPRHRANVRLSYQLPNFELGWVFRYKSRAVVDVLQGDIDGNSAPSASYNDLYSVLTLHGGWKARMGIDNIANIRPPLLAFGAAVNTFPEYYDVVGRRIYFSMQKTF